MPVFYMNITTRQFTSSQRQATLANAYEPYGVLVQTAGNAQTSYGFTGELTDPNRLISMSNRSTVNSYQCNGLGDRLTQNGVNYTLDTSTSFSAGLNSGLTQVLIDGTNTLVRTW